VIYALLHRQELFEPFRNNPRFFELTENLYTVIFLEKLILQISSFLYDIYVTRKCKYSASSGRSWSFSMHGWMHKKMKESGLWREYSSSSLQTQGHGEVKA
jgi:hypothetical protein